MITIHSFVFGPFQENTYLLYDETKECIVIDPGCYDTNERNQLADFIKQNNLNPIKLINTHCHLDHIFGNNFVANTFKVNLYFNKNEQRIFDAFLATCDLYNLNAEASPPSEKYIDEGDVIKIGNSFLEILFTPGHSPGSITLYNRVQKFMIAGDVLFYRSIGRTDLPGGNHQQLFSSIKNKLFLFDEDYTVYCGHGPSTSLGFEKKNNPFLIN